MSLQMGTKVYVPFFINETDLLAGTAQELVSPVAGYVTGIRTVVQKAVTTGGVIKAQVGTTDVAGCSVTIVDADAAGTLDTGSSTAGSSTRVVTAGGRVRVVPASEFATAGAVNGYLEIETSDDSPAV